MTSSLLRPAGSLGFPNMGATPPIMAPGQMPTNTGIVPPAAATTAAPAPAPAPAPAGHGGGPGGGHQAFQRPSLADHPGFLERLQAHLGGAGGLASRLQSRGIDMGALMARFGHPAAPPAAPAPAPAAAAPAPVGPVLNRPATII